MLADIRSRKLHVSHDRIVRLSTFDRTSQGMMILLGFIMSLVYMQAVHGWLSAYERLVNSQNFFSPYLTQEDLSRFGRNYLQVGYYTEILFPKKGVRFIAINNNVDSATPQDNDFTPFLNIMNVLFCFSTVFANGVKAHSIAKAPVTVSLRERRLQVLFLFRCCL